MDGGRGTSLPAACNVVGLDREQQPAEACACGCRPAEGEEDSRYVGNERRVLLNDEAQQQQQQQLAGRAGTTVVGS